MFVGVGGEGRCPVFCRIFSCIAGLHPVGVSSNPFPNCDNQKCLQTLPVSQEVVETAELGCREGIIAQIDESLMSQYVIGVHKDHYKSHDPSGRGSGWGATEVGGPAFSAAVF